MLNRNSTSAAVSSRNASVGAVRLAPVVAISRRTAMSQSKVEAIAGLSKLFNALKKSAADDKSVAEQPTHVHSPSVSATDPNNKMWCYQCEQTLNKEGCHSVGVCGKTPEVAGLQDLMIYQMKGLGCLSHHARQHGVEDQEVNVFINSTIFSTLTNVNFDDERMAEFVREADRLTERLRASLRAQGKPMPEVPDVPQLWGDMPHPLAWSLASVTNSKRPTAVDLLEISKQTTISVRVASLGETLCGLQELMAYGLKGLCAYAHHAEALGFRDQKVYADVAAQLAFLSGPECLDVNKTLAGCMSVGATNFRVMQLLDEAHTTTFGHPSPHKVSLAPKPGKSILITGHDMHDLKLLLDQTEGTGINVYTHGEMLPGHSYPGLRKSPHLAGHYGGAWYRQKTDFAHFPGSVLVTTNCVLDPLTSYRNNIFTTNETGLSGIHHIADKDFSSVIKRAQELPGFTPEDVAAFPQKEVNVGYAHNTVLGAAGEVVKAIQDNRLQHIFLIGGCDGNEPQRKYYSQLFKYMPEETLVLTLGCGKFRIFDQDFGNIPGTQLPRLMDMGQCNDAYSALVVATELAKVFKTDVNNLPLSLDLSWFEQKAVAVLLTLLNLGVRNIRLGPRLPAFLTPDAVKVLVDKFNLMPADDTHPEADVKAMLTNS